MITINNKEIEVLEGETLIEVARQGRFSGPFHVLCRKKQSINRLVWYVS